ncbi:MAG: hypothetical protein LBH97_02390, partial [Treponema sp.]|nr:hypothetical protein [Treponema sp.]
ESELDDAEREAIFSEAAQGRGSVAGKYSPEAMQKSREWCDTFYHKKTGKMDTLVRRERALAAAKPDLLLN